MGSTHPGCGRGHGRRRCWQAAGMGPWDKRDPGVQCRQQVARPAPAPSGQRHSAGGWTLPHAQPQGTGGALPSLPLTRVRVRILGQQGPAVAGRGLWEATACTCGVCVVGVRGCFGVGVHDRNWLAGVAARCSRCLGVADPSALHGKKQGCRRNVPSPEHAPCLSWPPPRAWRHSGGTLPPCKAARRLQDGRGGRGALLARVLCGLQRAAPQGLPCCGQVHKAHSSFS